MREYDEPPRPHLMPDPEFEHRQERPTAGVPGTRYDPRSLATLQRFAGNRAVARLLQTTVQRCGSAGCADCGPERDAEAEQGMEGIVDEPPLIMEQPVQRQADGTRPVQRVASFANGTVHETNNLANTVINGAPVGVTTPVINGTITSSGAQLQSSLAQPTLTTVAVPAGGFESAVDTIPPNTGSFDETVLSAGPWRINTTKAAFHALFPAVAGCGGAGDTRMRAFGDPSDAAMQAANRRHEDHHAADIRAAFTAIVVPWDQKLTAAKAAGTKFPGATAAAAEAALWAAMGGTPMQIANALINRIVSDSNAFHATPAGGTVRFSRTKRPSARSDCSISWVYLVNPS